MGRWASGWRSDGDPAEARLFFRAEDLCLRRFFAGCHTPEPGETVRVLHALRSAGGPLSRPGLVARAGLPTGRARTVLAARRLDESRVDMMRGYAETRGCRRHALLGHFGEPSPPRCDRCDNCRDGTAGAAAPDRRAAPTPERFAVGVRIRHDAWSDGEMLRRDGDTIVALFPGAGYRTLSERLVVDEGLLREIS